MEFAVDGVCFYPSTAGGPLVLYIYKDRNRFQVCIILIHVLRPSYLHPHRLLISTPTGQFTMTTTKHRNNDAAAQEAPKKQRRGAVQIPAIQPEEYVACNVVVRFTDRCTQ